MRTIPVYHVEAGDTIRLYGRNMQVTSVEQGGGIVALAGLHDGYAYEVCFFVDEEVSLIDSEYDPE